MRNPSVHVIYGTIIILLISACAFLSWRLLGDSMVYRRAIDYGAELAFAYGYSYGQGHDISKVYPEFHHRLGPIEFKDEVLSVEIWPAKHQWLTFRDPRKTIENGGMVDCFILYKD